ncbi:flavin reductase family protein [Actinosynnema sp. NPDC047251]|uniref:Flavin reductase domain-containing protein n=1 Tax=Saccharothrix espanaensis (strain ATCC 51144 / DSM 44229 / JCM 9112 / NBRC 15066 / NRRL 15764) TaxID=1179773 RepID=K0JZ72_SACES|nr:flavin reductase family protein [Saccharothrix espanaensis]CCH30557.1 Flavin reductase domain-containing protein [Saccharothrix espanaensis DSM 44229]
MTQSLPVIPVAEFRTLMSHFPTGVAIITTTAPDGEPRGMTVSSVCSVTLSPPTLLVCLRNGSPTLEAVLGSGTFAVNFLHGDARPVAELFASGAPDRFDLVPWRQPAGAAGPHLVQDAHAVADCRVSRTEPVGDHTVVFGETFQVVREPGHLPLLYGLREYQVWQADKSAESR